MMSKALKLALEALKRMKRYGNTFGYRSNEQNPYEQVCEAIEALEALAQPDFWEGYVPEPNSTCSNALRIQHKPYPRTCKKCGLGPCVELAQQALDKMAENARELGLDYEPAQPRAWFTIDELNAWADKKLKENPQWAEQPAQQEPVAFLANGTRFKISYDSRQSGGQVHGIPPELAGRWVAFVAADDDCHLKLTSPPSLSLAQRKPLTDEQFNDLVMEHLGPHALTGGKMSVYDAFLKAVRATEAAHGIKENT